MLIFTATFQDGSTKLLQGMLYLKLPVLIPTDPLMDDFWYLGLHPMGFNESGSTYGQTSLQNILSYEQWQYLKKLLKPIVIIDGFWSGDKRSRTAIPHYRPTNTDPLKMMSYQDATMEVLLTRFHY